ncbi:hypothetical protein J5Y09_21785 [Roseomonas sp. PWR1]|uniref:Uncharacterized protein n=1 Tax=Roseomonas nitratireducens TaxID=2820810 RepID=A0ABS4AYY2_9PROT|nr:hypothetical protein [Neoroseomonas nitratireducens]MBP0466575.1 hypothetical protein [Neoroseomonas nitratireducens]
MRAAAAALALAGLLAAGVQGGLFGALLAAQEVGRAPAVLGLVALLLLRDGQRGLAAAAGWTLAGAAGAVALRAAFGLLGDSGWIPGEETPRPDRALEAAWCFVVALLAWRGMAANRMGPLIAACVATTRIGGYGQALVPAFFEPTLGEALPVALNILAGYAAGVLVLLVAGWGVFVLARIPARVAAPGRVLATLAAAAGIGHMLRL